jgi:hypothetical protein
VSNSTSGSECPSDPFGCGYAAFVGQLFKLQRRFHRRSSSRAVQPQSAGWKTGQEDLPHAASTSIRKCPVTLGGPVTTLENNLETILRLALNRKINGSLNPLRPTSCAMMIIERDLRGRRGPRAVDVSRSDDTITSDGDVGGCRE